MKLIRFLSGENKNERGWEKALTQDLHHDKIYPPIKCNCNGILTFNSHVIRKAK